MRRCRQLHPSRNTDAFALVASGGQMQMRVCELIKLRHRRRVNLDLFR
jgi:hypothetical protein